MPKPLVFVPGFPASELLRRSQGGRRIFPPSLSDLSSDNRKRALLRLLEGPDDPPGDVLAGEPIRSVLRLGRVEIGKRAEALYQLLRQGYGYTVNSGDNFRAVGWDWRGAVDAARVLGDLRERILELSAANGGAPVVALVHSTGGLVLRRLLEQEPDLAARIEHVLALGVPWAGTLASLQTMTAGGSIGFGPFSLQAGEVRRVMRRAQAAYDLFPPDPAKTDLRDPFGAPLDLFVRARAGAGPRTQLGPLVDHDWMPRGSDFDFMRAMAADADARLGARPNRLTLPGGAAHPPVTNVVGWGVEMITMCAMDEDGDLRFERTKEGDGTVPAASASWLRGSAARFRTVFVPVGIYPTDQIPIRHSLIWDSPPLRQIFDEVLKDVPRTAYVYGSADSDEAIAPGSDVTVRLVAMDGQGRPLPEARFRVVRPGARARPFGNRVRLELVVRNADLRPDSRRMVRFVIEVTWAGAGGDESREVVILFKR